MYIILVSLVNGSMLKEYHASALYKWAKLLAKGEPAVSLAAVPTVVAKRKAIELWSDDDESPSYRPKNKECVKPIPIPSDIIGAPSPSANKLLVWSAGPAKSLVLPPKEEGDVDPESWVTCERRVRLLIFCCNSVRFTHKLDSSGESRRLLPYRG